MPKIVNRDEMRDKIAKGAMETFVRHGVHNTRIDQIAHAAAIGKGTIYLYFSSKDQICEYLVEQHFSNLEQALLQGPPADDLASLLAELETAMRPGDAHAQSIPVFFEVFGPSFGNEVFRRRISQFFTKMGRHYQKQIVHLQKHGVIRPDLAAGEFGRALASMVDGMILHRGLFGLSARKQKKLVAQTLLVIRQGLSAGPAQQNR